MSLSFGAIGSFDSTATDTVTLTHPNTPSEGVIAVAALDSGHPTATNIPEPVNDGWVFVDTIVGTVGVYGADAGPRRITIYMRALQDGDEDTVQFTMPIGSDSRLGGVIVHLPYDVLQPVIRYQVATGEDGATGTSFSAALSPSIEYDANEGEFVLIHYVVNSDTNFSAEAITAAGITFGTITERGDSNSSIGADAGRAIATGSVNAGAAVIATTVTATTVASIVGVAAVIRFRDLAVNSGPATITATYNDAAGLVGLEINRLDPNSTLVDIERSVDQIRWTTVRGGAALAISETIIISDSFAVASVDSWSDADTGQAYTLDGGVAADYDKVASGHGEIALPDTAGRRATIGPTMTDVDITVDVGVNTGLATGGAINAWLAARWTDTSNSYRARVRFETDDNVDLFIERIVGGSSTNIATVADVLTGYALNEMMRLRFRLVGASIQAKLWRAADPEPTTWTAEAIDTNLTTGQVSLQAGLNVGNTNTNPAVLFDNFSVAERVVTLNDYEFIPGVTNYYRITSYNEGLLVGDIETTSVLPDLSGIWIKSVTRPFLNIFIDGGCAAVGDNDTEMLVSDDVVRPTRTNVFPIVNRTYGIAVNDIGRGRQWTVKMRTHTLTALRTLDYLVASGDVIFIQVPPGCGDTIPNGYVTFYDAAYSRPHKRRRNTAVWTIPVEEVAPPGPDVVYAEATWATVIAQYATWADLIAANPTWADVLALLPDPSEVIVP